MSKGMIALGIFLFAAATAVLYVWGLKKSVTQGQDLEQMLLNKCGGKVIKHLKRHGSIDQKEIVGLLSGVRAGQFWSRRRITVQDPKKFSKQLIDYLVSQQYMESIDKGRFRLKNNITLR